MDGKSKGAWLNRSSIIYAGTDKWSGDPRVSIISSIGEKHEYSLQIQKVDVADDGMYTCSTQSKRNTAPKNIQLIVRGKRLHLQSSYGFVFCLAFVWLSLSNILLLLRQECTRSNTDYWGMFLTSNEQFCFWYFTANSYWMMCGDVYCTYTLAMRQRQ